MFAQIHLWETGILLIGIGFVIIAVYIAKTLKSLTQTIVDVDKVILDNTQNIKNIVDDLNTVTNTMTRVVGEVEESVNSIKSSLSDVEKTVSSTKNYLLRPTLKSLSIMRSMIKFVISLKNKISRGNGKKQDAKS